MKTFRTLAAILLFFSLLAGCIPSVHPLYHKEDLIMDESILGLWRDFGDEGTTWNIMKIEPKTYGVILTVDSVPALFKVHLVKLAGSYFMDFYPEEFDLPGEESTGFFDALDNPYECVNDFLSLHLFPVHTFARVDIQHDHLEIRRFNAEWLDGLFEKNKVRIAHEKTDDNILLTASTDELQAFVSKYAGEKEAYVQPERLVRIK